MIMFEMPGGPVDKKKHFITTSSKHETIFVTALGDKTQEFRTKLWKLCVREFRDLITITESQVEDGSILWTVCYKRTNIITAENIIFDALGEFMVSVGWQE